ncbi:DNA helicase PcrA [Planctomycetota bacterium]|nr:DNA helicase PcrA [Planctomycetota bacterium]
MSQSFLDDLNDAQRAAVLHGEGPLMVLAGAGSGKTRVVTRRIARLLDQGVRSSQILALTFTNKAAGEMANRVQALFGGYVRVATFHSACARFLRSDATLLGYPANFSIYDTYDRDSLIKSLLEDVGLTSTKVKPAAVGSMVSRLKNCATKPGDSVLGDNDIARAVERIWQRYEERMQQLGAMDFDDLLLCFLRLLREHPQKAESYRERFPWLLVDEFQDTNRVQYDILRALSKQDGNICVVGDPDQSIYGFRGAEVRNILDFEDHYPGTTVVRLEQNYRSSANILSAAESVIENNKLRKQKRLRTDNAPGDKLLLFHAGGPSEEADAIADRVLGLSGEGAALDQIAIFYRAHYLSRSIEQSLKDKGVPYEIVGGLTFFERREIKDLLAYLRVLVNPLDDVSMQRIINVPPRGLGKTSLDKLKDAAAAEGMSLREGVSLSELHVGLSAKSRKALLQLGEALDKAQAASSRGAHQALKVILEGTGYIQHATGIGDPDDIAREENIQELVSDTISFDEKNGEGLAGYLQHVSLLTSADRNGGSGPAVQMMSVHAAKGLEFDHVFIAGLEDSVFPSMRAAAAKDGIEEERRLMYVALTRARRTLFLSHARERMVNGSMERMQPSRFLKEIPKGLLADHEAVWHRFSREEDRADWSPDPDPDPDAVIQVSVGARVRHDMYGAGTIRRVSGMGIMSRAVVRFDDGIDRELILEYAGLQQLGDGDFDL